jgi:hypothetical protein
MSWSANFIGTPEKVKDALQKQSIGLTGQSKEEFDVVLPYLFGIIDQNFNNDHAPVIKLIASGHGQLDIQRSCSVNIEQLWGLLV